MLDTYIIERFAAHVSATCVAQMTEAENSTIVQQWIDGTSEPSADQAQKITIAYDIFDQAWRARGAEAVHWFTGAHLNLPSPWLSIKNGQYDEARASMEQFINRQLVGPYR